MNPAELATAAAVALLAAALGFLAPRVFPFIGALENQVADIRLATLAPPEPQYPKIVIAAVTEDTLATLPYRSPLDRQFLAGLLSALDAAGPAAIGIDILLDQPTEPQKDAMLKTVLGSMKTPLVAAWAGREDGLTEKQTAFLDGFLEKTTKAPPNLLTDSRDGVARWIFPGREQGGKYIPGFTAALAAVLGVKAPVGEIPIAYRAPPDATTPPFRIFPAHTIRFLPKVWLKDKVILVGADLPHGDRHRTPLAAAGGGTVPGVIIHAHALAQVLDGRKAPGLGAGGESALVVAVAALGLLLAAANWGVAVKTAATLAGLVLVWAGGFWLFQASGPLLPLVTPSLSFAAATGLGAAYMGRRQRAQKRFIRKAFSKLISPSIVNEMVEDPTRFQVALTGERREITYMFTDIAGFTSLTEQMSPEVVLPLLNEYLDGMCRIALDHQATIDKIVGDAVVTFFNAPVDQPDHPVRAMDCVKAMDAFARDFAETQKAKGIAFGVTRFGVNTGTAVVGNFGGDAFFDYTGHGDSVNTAARLESANKHFGTTVCIAGNTAERCPDIRFRPIGAVILKGKEEGLEVFEPLTEDAADSQSTQDYMAAYELMRAEDPAALAAFEQLAEAYPDDTLAALHLGRLRAGDTGATFALAQK